MPIYISSKIKWAYIYILYMGNLPIHIYHLNAGCPWTSEKGIGSTGTEARDGCELSCSTRDQIWVLQKSSQGCWWLSLLSSPTSIYFHLPIIYLLGCLYAHTYTMAHMWRSEGNLQELLLSFHHVVPRGQIQVSRPGSECLYPLSHVRASILL